MKNHILLIDDDPDELSFFTDALKEIHGFYTCDYACDVDQALVLLSSFTPDLIFLDINLPKINGIDGLAMIRKAEKLKDIPVIIYSTGLNDEIARRAKALGAADCVRKPYSYRSMVAMLKRILLHEWFAHNTS